MTASYWMYTNTDDALPVVMHLKFCTHYPQHYIWHKSYFAAFVTTYKEQNSQQVSLGRIDIMSGWDISIKTHVIKLLTRLYPCFYRNTGHKSAVSSALLNNTEYFIFRHSEWVNHITSYYLSWLIIKFELIYLILQMVVVGFGSVLLYPFHPCVKNDSWSS